MIQKRHMAPLLAGLMLLAACNKEQDPLAIDETGVPEGHLKVNVENPTAAAGTKQLLDGLYTYWKNNDPVYVNGVSNSVIVPSSGTPYLRNTVSTPASGYYYIATTLATSLSGNDFVIPANGKTFNLSVPYSYNYSRTSDGKADLGTIPMVAVSERTSGVLNFKHLTATVNVAITNGINSNFRVSSVEVSSNAQLSEYRAVTLHQNGNVEVSFTERAGQTSTGRHRKVIINFPSNTDVAYNETLNVPVPILPVVSGKTLTVTVTGTYPYGQPLNTVGSPNLANAPGAGSTATYTRTITLNSDLSRNDYANADVQLKPSVSYFSSNVMNNWVKFCYSSHYLYGDQMCLWSELVNESRPGSFEFTADHLRTMVCPENTGNNNDEAGSLLVWHQDANCYKLLIFPYGKTRANFPTNVRANVNALGFSLVSYSSNANAPIPCISGSYNFLGGNSISFNPSTISSNYITLDIATKTSDNSHEAAGAWHASSQSYRRSYFATNTYWGYYKGMTLKVEEKTETVYRCEFDGVYWIDRELIETKKTLTYSVTTGSNLNPSSPTFYGIPAHNN